MTADPNGKPKMKAHEGQGTVGLNEASRADEVAQQGPVAKVWLVGREARVLRTKVTGCPLIWSS